MTWLAIGAVVAAALSLAAARTILTKRGGLPRQRVILGLQLHRRARVADMKIGDMKKRRAEDLA